MRTKETELEDDGYAQWFEQHGVTIRIQTNKEMGGVRSTNEELLY